MTGSFIQTGFRHMHRNSAATLENENVALVADRSKRCKQTSQRQFNEGKNRRNSKKHMYFSDDSYVTTASQDERIEQELRQEKEKEKSMQDLLDSKRQQIFEEVFEEKTHEIFHLPGLSFLKFTHMKIKLCFEPCKIVTLVKKDVKFYCSLRYYKESHFWNVRRDSFPANYKMRIYNIFYKGKSFSVTDDNVGDAIFRIYEKLILWAKEEEEFRQEKFLRYQNGEDVDLDTDDEELFLTEEERKELKDKREMILKRMIPPKDAYLQELPPESPIKKRRRVLPPERPKKKHHREVPPECTPPKEIIRRRLLSTTDSD